MMTMLTFVEFCQNYNKNTKITESDLIFKTSTLEKTNPTDSDRLNLQCLHKTNPIPTTFNDILYLPHNPSIGREKTRCESKCRMEFGKVIPKKAPRNLLLGTASGFVAGVTFMKIGKVAAFGLGGSVILLHFATELGYIQVNWERIREAAKQGQTYLDQIIHFMYRNSCYSMGFVGGFFFGMASA